MDIKTQIVVIGAGPGGYVAAIKAAKANFDVICIDKAELGGICLNWGCIPTKALLKSAEVLESIKHAKEYGIKVSDVEVDLPSMVARSRKVSATMNQGIEFLFKKNKVDHLKATAKVISSNLVEAVLEDGSVKLISCDKVIIATGASPVTIPSIPYDGKNIISYREALTLKSIPKKMLIVGAGAIGCEFAYFFNSLGSEVHLIEMQDDIMPLEDEESSKFLKKSFISQGIKVHTKAKCLEAKVQKSKVSCLLELENEKPSKQSFDIVLVAVGMKANTSNLNLQACGVSCNERGHIIVDEVMQSSSENIYAIGDCTGKQMLAHKASFEAEVLIANLQNHKMRLDYNQVPACTYCQPQVASIGLTEKDAKSKHSNIKIGKFPFSASGKAQAINHSEGYVKLIFEGENDQLIGAHIVGYDATEMIAELSLALKIEATYDEIVETMHAHPTLAESVMEAALNANNQAVHI